MTGRIVALLALSLALAPTLGGCASPEVSGTLRALRLEPDGELRLGAEPIGEARSSLDALGIRAEETNLSPRVDVRAGGAHLSLSAESYSDRGPGTADATITFGGQSITVGTPVVSTLDVERVGGSLTFDVVPGPVELGVGLGVQQLDFVARVESQLAPIAAETREKVPIPTLALRLGVRGDDLAFEALFNALDISIDDVDVDYMELDVAGRWRFWHGTPATGTGFAELELGWRSIEVDARFADASDDLDGDVQLSGPFLGLRVGV